MIYNEGRKNLQDSDLELEMKKQAEKQYTDMIKKEFDTEFEQQLVRNRGYGRRKVDLYH